MFTAPSPLLPSQVVREEIVALAGSDVKLGDGNIQNGVWYSDRRSDYVRHLAGAGDWFDISGDYFLIRSINYDLQGKVIYVLKSRSRKIVGENEFVFSTIFYNSPSIYCIP